MNTDVLDELETSEAEWYHDGRNVTAVAAWWVDNRSDLYSGQIAGRMVARIYEAPWECPEFWASYQAWCRAQ